LKKIISVFIVGAFSISLLTQPVWAETRPKCDGEFDTQAVHAEVVDSYCFGGEVLIDSEVEIAVPKSGHVVEVSWLSALHENYEMQEVKIENLNNKIIVSSDPSVVSIFYSEQGSSGSYPLDLVDSGCSNSSRSNLGNDFPLGLDWWYNTVGQPSYHSQYRVRGAFATWERQTNRCGIPFKQNSLITNFKGLTDSPESMGGNPPPYLGLCPVSRQYDGLNVIGWGKLPTGVVAYTCVTKQYGTNVIDGDIRFSTDFNWFDSATEEGCSRAYDLGDIATHEVGHLIGLGHAADLSDQVMDPDARGCNFRNRKLAKGDLLSLDANY
jgi:hypothetical protein